MLERLWMRLLGRPTKRHAANILKATKCTPDTSVHSKNLDEGLYGDICNKKTFVLFDGKYSYTIKGEHFQTTARPSEATEFPIGGVTVASSCYGSTFWLVKVRKAGRVIFEKQFPHWRFEEIVGSNVDWFLHEEPQAEAV